MTLRRRFALVAAAAVAVAIVLASGIVYVVVRGELRGRVDDELRGKVPQAVVGAGGELMRQRLGATGGDLTFQAGAPPSDATTDRFVAPRDALGLQTAYVAIVSSNGQVVLPPDERARLPVTADTRAVAAGIGKSFFTDARVDGTSVRVFTQPGPPGYAVQVARPLTEVERTLDRLALVLVLVSVGGIALAAVLARFVARTALQPVAELTDTVEHVAATSDLSQRIVVADGGEDELSRLARSFNGMLAALASSVGRQRQLVADASHELRTPLTSLRTNAEVLARSPGMPDAERERLLADVVGQLDELGALVGDVVELAREEEPVTELEDVRFDELVAAAVARARGRAGAPRFATALEPCLVRGVPARLDRAVSNLLDNAAKWSPPAGEVDVTLAGGELTVHDHGPGIAPEDLPHVFERFYRAPGARGMPGSGLGLAIVRQVAELHGGRVDAQAANGGGALLRLTLPAEVVAAMVDTEPLSCQPS